MKLKNIDPLHHLLSASEQQLVLGSFESKKTRRVWTKGEIRSYGPNRGAVADAETVRLHGIVEVLEIALAKSQADPVYGRVHITDIVKQHASQVIAHQWEAQLHCVEQQRIAADGET